jgi:hypothetical protein
LSGGVITVQSSLNGHVTASAADALENPGPTIPETPWIGPGRFSFQGRARPQRTTVSVSWDLNGTPRLVETPGMVRDTRPRVIGSA